MHKNFTNLDDLEFIYQPQRYFIENRKFVKDLGYDPASDTMLQFHNCENRRDFLRAGTYWSELLTDFPEVAGLATGLFDGECCWRAEWSLPRSDIVGSLRYNARTRMAGVLNSREYINIHDLFPHAVTWVQMEPVGTSA